MVVGFKNVTKLFGIIIITCCAVLVCNIFLNFYMDIQLIKNLITEDYALIFYEAQVSTSKITTTVSGGCLLITSVIMLIFYIKHYIDTHKKELGILKALGYSNLKIAKGFWVFGLSIFFGTFAGFCGSFLLIPSFYELQNKDNILPEIAINLHPELFICLVLLPTAAFALLSVFYACFKLKRPTLSLLKDTFEKSAKPKKHKAEKERDCSFIAGLKKSTVMSKKSLIFFIVFAAFCFSSMTQMSASMKELASEMMGIMILILAIILACTMLFIAISTVISANTKTIAMMRVFGYSHKECCNALLSGYRLPSYIGFAVGSVYQYALLRIMVDIVFKDIANVPTYEFDFKMLFISLAFFIIFYEALMFLICEKIKKISIKEIMLET